MRIRQEKGLPFLIEIFIAIKRLLEALGKKGNISKQVSFGSRMVNFFAL